MTKKIIFLIVLAFSMTFPIHAEEATPAPQKNNTVVSDQQQLREAAKVLGKAFDVEIKDENKPEEQAAPPPQKTLADVADKGLDMVQNFAVQLSKTLQNMAPTVWRIMVQQQYAKAIGNLVVPWGCIGLLMLYIFLIKKWWKLNEESDNDEETAHLWVTKIVPIALTFLFAFWGFNRLSDAILLLINPEYYAIKDLLEMILK